MFREAFDNQLRSTVPFLGFKLGVPPLAPQTHDFRRPKAHNPFGIPAQAVYFATVLRWTKSRCVQSTRVNGGVGAAFEAPCVRTRTIP
jgi:hypothetical protein